MHILKPGLVYFLIVFGAGFALAFVRIPLLIPAFGVRTAELMEAPVMLMIIVWASRRIVRQHPELRRQSRLAIGLFAFALLVAFELAVAYYLGVRSLSDYVASRDPVAGSVYLLSLMFFAVAPALWRVAPAPNRSLKADT